MLVALVPLNQLSSSFTRIDGQVFDGMPGNFCISPLSGERSCSVSLCLTCRTPARPDARNHANRLVSSKEALLQGLLLPLR